MRKIGASNILYHMLCTRRCTLKINTDNNNIKTIENTLYPQSNL